MNIINNDCESLTVSDELFQTYLEDPTLKTIEVTVGYNCCDSLSFETTIEMNESSSGSESSEAGNEYVTIVNNTLVIDHSLFASLKEDSMADGIYTVTVKFTLESGEYYSNTNCLFVDNVSACLLVTYMADNLGTEKSTSLAMIHYALTEGANCECTCSNMCTLFEYLWNNISTTNTTINCGC